MNSRSANTTAAANQIRHDAEEAAQNFPSLLLEAERIAATVAAGVHGRRRAGAGETFWQHRPYAFGDPVSSIDWRQSARTADRLYIRQNEWEAPAALYIWRDPSRSLDYASQKNWPTKRRRADVLSIALAILLSQAGERIGVLGDARPPVMGRTAPERILEALQVDEYNDAADAPRSIRLRAGDRVVFISDFYTDDEFITDSVRMTSKAGAHGALLQICDPSEEEFPFEGRTEFEDLESPDRLIFGDAGAIGEDYRALFQAHRTSIEAVAHRAGWSFISHRTDKPAQHALLALFAAVGDQRLWTS
ncbi:MAG: DUF58 domain-containing protein [Pseudomonadota bacterium]